MKQAALLGMPNCGKSSLFHLLTGKHVPTGNRAGVTVDACSAPLSSVKSLLLTDLPGIRSPHPASEDEQVTMQYLTSNSLDLLIAVIDVTDAKRQLPAIHSILDSARIRADLILLNFCDALEQFPDSAVLTKLLRTPTLCISARTGQGIPALLDMLRAFASGDFPHTQPCSPQDSCSSCSSCPHDCPHSFSVNLTSVLAECKPLSSRRGRMLQRLDALILCPALGLPLFFALMAFLLFLVFGPPGEALTSGFCTLLLTPCHLLLQKLCLSAPEWLSSLVLQGIFGGVGAVLSFIPRLLMLFFFQSLMEQSGFLARMARLFDPLLCRFGLRGDAITPLLLGFGCTVPAILCTRSMKDSSARERCAGLLSSVACSARMPLCLLIASCCFPGGGWGICALVWLFSGCCFLSFCALTAKIRRIRTLPEQHSDPLPRWLFPDPVELLRAMLEQLRHFLAKAGGTILLFSVLVWILSSFRPGTAGIVSPENSMLAQLGKLISPLFAPLGLSDWRLTSALLAGIGAKEAALSTLGILFGGKDLVTSLQLSGILTPASALSLLCFYTLYFPCTATISTLRPRERRYLLLPLAFAYLFSALLYQVLGLV